MEDGYTRKKPETKAKRQQRLEKRAARARARYAEKKAETGKPARGLGKKNIEVIEKSKGKPLAKEVLEVCMLRCLALSQKYYPIQPDGEVAKNANPELFMDVVEATARFASWLAPYQSPRLAALAITEAPRELSEETTFTINIFDARGGHVAKVIDGEVVPETVELEGLEAPTSQAEEEDALAALTPEEPKQEGKADGGYSPPKVKPPSY